MPKSLLSTLRLMVAIGRGLADQNEMTGVEDNAEVVFVHEALGGSDVNIGGLEDEQVLDITLHGVGQVDKALTTVYDKTLK